MIYFCGTFTLQVVEGLELKSYEIEVNPGRRSGFLESSSFRNDVVKEELRLGVVDKASDEVKDAAEISIGSTSRPSSQTDVVEFSLLDVSEVEMRNRVEYLSAHLHHVSPPTFLNRVSLEMQKREEQYQEGGTGLSHRLHLFYSQFSSASEVISFWDVNGFLTEDMIEEDEEDEEAEEEIIVDPVDPSPSDDEDKLVVGEGWEYRGMIIPDRSLTGFDYRLAGVQVVNNRVVVLYQSKHNLANKARTAGSIASSQDLSTWIQPSNNPVLADAMSWQGTDTQGRAHRTGAATMISWNNELIAYYRDRVGNYPGMRAMGVATSQDGGMSWTQLDEPFFTVEDVKRIVPAKYFEADPVFTQGRVYINFATVADGYVYIEFTTVINGKHDGRQYESFMARGTNPLDAGTFEFVETPWLYQGRSFFAFHKVDDSWYRLSRLATTESGERVRYTVISKSNDLSAPFSEDMRIATQISSNPSAEEMFYYQGKWHIMYSDRSGNIHLLSQVQEGNLAGQFLANRPNWSTLGRVSVLTVLGGGFAYYLFNRNNT